MSSETRHRLVYLTGQSRQCARYCSCRVTDFLVLDHGGRPEIMFKIFIQQTLNIGKKNCFSLRVTLNCSQASKYK